MAPPALRDCGASITDHHMAPPPPQQQPAAAGPFTLWHAPSPSHAVAASSSNKVHSLAEKRRRERINTHLATLRRMIPNSSKLDKASLLGKVIEQVQDLKREASSIRSRGLPVPTDVNEVQVDLPGQELDKDQQNKADDDDDGFDHRDPNLHQPVVIKACICCDDRPDLFADIVQAFGQLELQAVRAEMVCLGGRVRNVFFLCKPGAQGGGARGWGAAGAGTVGGGELRSLLRQVREALGRVSAVDAAAVDGMSSKRRRLMQLQYPG